MFYKPSLLMQSTESYFSKAHTRIWTPKLIPQGGSESGSEVFKIQNLEHIKNLCLAQSPQLYKQLAINSGFKKVYEIGLIFRAEKFNTSRHSYEALCLDVEEAKNELDTILLILENYIRFTENIIGGKEKYY